MQPNWNAPEELIGDLAWQTKINLAGRLPPLPSPRSPAAAVWITQLPGLGKVASSESSNQPAPPRCLLPSAWLRRLLSMPRASWLAPGRQGTWHSPHLLASWWINKMDCSTHEKCWDADISLLRRVRRNVTTRNSPEMQFLFAARTGYSLLHFPHSCRGLRSFSGVVRWGYFIYIFERIWSPKN